MNLRDLEYLVALDRFRHFGKAAKHCFVSQPTLSGQLMKLEEELGVQLIERGRRRAVVFTEAGNAILERARVILAESQKIVTLAESFRSPLSGTLKLAAIPTVGPYLLPLVLDPLREALPDLTFELFELTTAEIVDALFEGRIDAGLLALPLERGGLVEMPLFEESFSLALPGKHPHGTKKHVSESWLDKEKLLLLEEGHCFRHQALQVCNAYNADADREYRASSLETLRYMVQMGEGLTLVPELTMKMWEETSGTRTLSFVPFRNPAPVRQVGLLYRSGSVRTECFARIGDVVTQVAGRRLAPRRGKREVIPVE